MLGNARPSATQKGRRLNPPAVVQHCVCGTTSAPKIFLMFCYCCCSFYHDASHLERCCKITSDYAGFVRQPTLHAASRLAEAAQSTPSARVRPDPQQCPCWLHETYVTASGGLPGEFVLEIFKNRRPHHDRRMANCSILFFVIQKYTCDRDVSETGQECA